MYFTHIDTEGGLGCSGELNCMMCTSFDIYLRNTQKWYCFMEFTRGKLNNLL